MIVFISLIAGRFHEEILAQPSGEANHCPRRRARTIQRTVSTHQEALQDGALDEGGTNGDY